MSQLKVTGCNLIKGMPVSSARQLLKSSKCMLEIQKGQRYLVAIDWFLGQHTDPLLFTIEREEGDKGPWKISVTW